MNIPNQFAQIGLFLADNGFVTVLKELTLRQCRRLNPAASQTDTPSNPSDSLEKEVTSDGSLIAYASSVVFDKNTGLEWFAGPDRDTNWNESKTWAENLNVAGGGWRMPSIQELKMLYQEGSGTRNMTSLLKTSGWWVWSRDIRNSQSVWAFSFSSGNVYSPNRDYSNNGRGFAVRSRRQ